MVRQVGAKLMEHILCELVNSYDKRALTRRKLVRALATLTGAGAIDHLSIPWTIVNDDNRP